MAVLNARHWVNQAASQMHVKRKKGPPAGGPGARWELNPYRLLTARGGGTVLGIKVASTSHGRCCLWGERFSLGHQLSRVGCRLAPCAEAASMLCPPRALGVQRGRWLHTFPWHNRCKDQLVDEEMSQSND